MRLWTLLKLIAALLVMAVMTFTGLLAYHVFVAPLGGPFARIIPTPAGIATAQTDTDFAKVLEASEMPDIDPGEKTFQKAHELLALGDLAAAREKLTAIVNVFPASASAPVARRIVGDMNLDEILSTSQMAGKQLHVVKRGDSFIALTTRYQTTLECLIHLNSMLEPRQLHPGDELVVMPLNFRLLLEPRRKALSLWDGGRFVCEYEVIQFPAMANTPRKTTISSKTADFEGKRIQPQAKNYRRAEKSIQLTKPTLTIRGWNGTGDRPAGAILLHPQDMEELNLLTRVGNEVEVR